jgi:hypothetical protein
MDMKILNVLLVGCLVVFMSCEYGLEEPEGPSSDDKGGTGGNGGSGSGGDQEDGGGGQPEGGDDAGQAGTGDESHCPSGFRCTAPGGVFMCTDQETYLPPLCQEDADCKFGTCSEVLGAKYCVKECAPEVVAECPGASVCNRLYDGANICAQSIIWSAPPCQTQDDCPFGECQLSYFGLNLCVQPCESTIVQTCPGDTACVPLEGKFFCADPSIGVPPTCSSDGDCEYGKCVPYYEQGFCTQECEPPVVDTCPDESVCRFHTPLGFYCSDASTLLPPECQRQADCAYGICIKYGEQGYCTEYCSQPGIELIGTVLGTDGPVEGVEVCLFDGEETIDEECGETDENGEFALLRLPNQPYFVVSMTKEGYQSSLQLAYANQFTSALIFTEEEMQDAADELGADYLEEDTGQIVFMALSMESVEGYTVELDREEGDGPYYADEGNELVDPDSLDAASSSAWGAYFNVPVDTYFLDFTGDNNIVCADLPAVTVVEGYLSVVVSYCYSWEDPNTGS